MALAFSKGVLRSTPRCPSIVHACHLAHARDLEKPSAAPSVSFSRSPSCFVSRALARHGWDSAELPAALLLAPSQAPSSPPPSSRATLPTAPLPLTVPLLHVLPCSHGCPCQLPWPSLALVPPCLLVLSSHRHLLTRAVLRLLCPSSTVRRRRC
jgi:hypothetical protein